MTPGKQAPSPAAYPIETLHDDDMTLTQNTGAGSLQTIMQFVVPRGEARALVRYPGRLNIGARQLFTGTGAATVFTLTNPIAQGSRNFPNPVRAFRNGVSTPASLLDTNSYAPGTEDTYVTGAPGAGQFGLTNVGGPADTYNTITFGTAPNATVGGVAIYYPMLLGLYSVSVFTPNERRNDTWANGSVRRLNSAPQDDVNSAFTVAATTPWFSQDYFIRVMLNASVIVNFEAVNIYTTLELPYTRVPLSALKGEEAVAVPAILGA